MKQNVVRFSGIALGILFAVYVSAFFLIPQISSAVMSA